MKVVDASAMIDVLTLTSRGRKLLPIIDDDLFAPDLLIPEVYSFLRRMVAAKRLTPPAADELSLRLRQAPIEYLPTWPCADRMWGWRQNVSPYDAAYVALAADLGAPLVTTDSRLSRAAEELATVITV
ncbi:MAG: type II toxin-antitoxin system VapC family toxin [Actinobacteria bacterium]|nr:type II toxin-antitoxin system VapC family toxin [Actinomycetota bacterium]